MIPSTQVHGQAAAAAANYLAGWQRARADLVNFQKNLAQQNLQQKTSQLKALLEPLLSLADNFRAMSQHLPPELADHTWSKGVLHIARQLDTILSQYHVAEIKAAGQLFNPRLHEAVEQIPNTDLPAGTIVSVVQNGYQLGDDILRPARVKVAVKK